MVIKFRQISTIWKNLALSIQYVSCWIHASCFSPINYCKYLNRLGIKIAWMLKSVNYTMFKKVCSFYFLNISIKQVVKIIWHKAILPPQTDGSVVFARWCQCAPPSNTWFFGPPESTSKMAHLSVHPSLQSWQHSFPILYSGPHLSPQCCCPFSWGIWTPI